MQRRTFLARSSRAAVGLSLLWPAACSHRARTSSDRNGNRDGNGESRALLAGLENEIAMRMEEEKVPGLSIAIIKNANLYWRRAFGVKDSASREPVNNDTLFEAASVSKTVFAYAVMNLCVRPGHHDQ